MVQFELIIFASVNVTNAHVDIGRISFDGTLESLSWITILIYNSQNTHEEVASYDRPSDPPVFSFGVNPCKRRSTSNVYQQIRIEVPFERKELLLRRMTLLKFANEVDCVLRLPIKSEEAIVGPFVEVVYCRDYKPHIFSTFYDLGIKTVRNKFEKLVIIASCR